MRIGLVCWGSTRVRLDKVSGALFAFSARSLAPRIEVSGGGDQITVTLGIYYLVWYYKINKEMRRAYGIDVDSAMAVIDNFWVLHHRAPPSSAFIGPDVESSKRSSKRESEIQ